MLSDHTPFTPAKRKRKKHQLNFLSCTSKGTPHSSSKSPKWQHCLQGSAHRLLHGFWEHDCAESLHSPTDLLESLTQRAEQNVLPRKYKSGYGNYPEQATVSSYPCSASRWTSAATAQRLLCFLIKPLQTGSSSSASKWAIVFRTGKGGAVPGNPGMVP